MSYNPATRPAPCIIDNGTIVNKQDQRRLLNDLGRVRYVHILDGDIQAEGEGCILDVFADAYQSTLIANQTLYINVNSFDYLQLTRTDESETYFDLIQDNRQLRLIPLSTPLQEPTHHIINESALEAMVTQVLAAKWDMQFDDDDDCYF
jgi:hypothetical protein